VTFEGTERVPVSVVVPAYNAAAFLPAALQSIAAQTLQPLETIVVDDASSDETAAIAASFGARVICQPRNMGPSAARNAGVAAAAGAWVAFLDADDWWSREKLALQWKALQRWPGASFCLTDYDVIREDGVLLQGQAGSHPGYQAVRASDRDGDAACFSPESFIDGLVRSMFVRQSSVIASRAVFARCGGYDEALRLGEDYDLFLRMVAFGPAVAVERSLVTYCRRPASLSSDPIAEVDSIDALWEGILRRPDRYPARTVAAVRARRVHTLLAGTRLGLRLGRFPDAARWARKAFDLEPSRATRFWCTTVRLVSNPVGRFAHRCLRDAWRRRSLRSAPAAVTPTA
jgi:glycosyltransferase involved in cell wall biosynthesis